jgi:hypothetical protein
MLARVANNLTEELQAGAERCLLWPRRQDNVMGYHLHWA